MKKSMLFAAFAFIAFAVTGCTAINTSQGADAPKVKITKEYTADIEHKNTVVAGQATVYNLFGIFTWGVSNFADYAFAGDSSFPSIITSPMTLAKQGATYNACEASGSDMLLGAKYKITTQDYIVFKIITCDASGFPGVLKGIK